MVPQFMIEKDIKQRGPIYNLVEKPPPLPATAFLGANNGRFFTKTKGHQALWTFFLPLNISFIRLGLLTKVAEAVPPFLPEAARVTVFRQTQSLDEKGSAFE
jgi:hypothetical protein